MPRSVSLVLGVVLLLLGAAKAAGLLLLLAAPTWLPSFALEQTVYTACLGAGGVALLSAGRKQRTREVDDA